MYSRTRQQIEQSFEVLTQDIDDLINKPWLKTSIKSHLKGWCPVATPDEISTIVEERITGPWK